MFRHKPDLYLILSHHKVWGCSGDQCFVKFSEEALTSTVLLEFLKQQDHAVNETLSLSSRKLFLFLEFPWVLTHFEECVLLSTQEASHYLCSHFETLKPETSRSEGASSFSNNIAAAFFPANNLGKQGVLSVAPSSQLLELIKEIQKDWKLQVQWTPLLYLCLPEIIESSKSSVSFQGLEQEFFIQTENHCLTQIVEIPKLHVKESSSFYNASGVRKFFSDLILEHSTHPEHLYLLEKNPLQNTNQSGNQSTGLINSENPKTFDGRSLSELLKSWKGYAKNPNKGFWKAEQEAQENRKSWLLAGVIFLLVAVIAIGIWQLHSELESLKTQVFAQQKIDQKTKNIEMRTLQNKQIQDHKRLKALHSKLTQKSALNQKSLKQILDMLKGVWLQEVRYTEQTLQLRLLSFSAQALPELLSELEQIPLVEQATLRSQQQTKIAEKALILSEVVLILRGKQL